MPERVQPRHPLDGGVPAITVALMAPIEMPHTQSGWKARSASAW